MYRRYYYNDSGVKQNLQTTPPCVRGMPHVRSYYTGATIQYIAVPMYLYPTRLYGCPRLQQGPTNRQPGDRNTDRLSHARNGGKQRARLVTTGRLCLGRKKTRPWSESYRSYECKPRGIPRCLAARSTEWTRGMRMRDVLLSRNISNQQDGHRLRTQVPMVEATRDQVSINTVVNTWCIYVVACITPSMPV